MRKIFLLLILNTIWFHAYGQSDFFSANSQKAISKYKITEVTSYIFPEGGKPGDSILADQMAFNKQGQCVEHGNLAAKKSTDVDNKYNYTTNYAYNNKNQLVTVDEIKRDSAMTIVSNTSTVYQYRFDGDELIKTESIYDAHENLTAQKEFIYDRHGNQLKAYEISNAGKRLFWDYKFNKNDQVIESVGGPSVFFFPSSRDIRRDDLAHFFYTYDEAGNLIEIKKYQRDNYGEERLTAIEKIRYTTY